jgi:F0F1-type ATP synthase membrane subunit c/vacuolar-type H+-ATPase subunit K
MMHPMLAEMAGSIHVGLAALGSAIGVGLIFLEKFGH